MFAIFILTAGTCTIPTRDRFIRPPRLQPVDHAGPFIPDFGAMLNFTQQFLILPCDQGPRAEGASPGDPEPNYPVTPATRDAIFDQGSLTVTCVFDVENGKYVLDRRGAMDCETYGSILQSISRSFDLFLEPLVSYAWNVF